MQRSLAACVSTAHFCPCATGGPARECRLLRVLDGKGPDPVEPSLRGDPQEERKTMPCDATEGEPHGAHRRGERLAAWKMPTLLATVLTLPSLTPTLSLARERG